MDSCPDRLNDWPISGSQQHSHNDAQTQGRVSTANLTSLSSEEKSASDSRLKRSKPTRLSAVRRKASSTQGGTSWGLISGTVFPGLSTTRLLSRLGATTSRYSRWSVAVVVTPCSRSSASTTGALRSWTSVSCDTRTSSSGSSWASLTAMTFPRSPPAFPETPLTEKGTPFCALLTPSKTSKPHGFVKLTHRLHEVPKLTVWFLFAWFVLLIRFMLFVFCFPFGHQSVESTKRRWNPLCRQENLP